MISRYVFLTYSKCNIKTVWQAVSSSHSYNAHSHLCFKSLFIPCVEAELQNFKSHNIMCAKAELRDLKPKRLYGNGTAERQVAVYFLCGSRTTGHPNSIPCEEAESQTLNSHNILCAEAELKVPVQWRQNLKYRICTWYAHEVCKGLILN